MLETLLTLDQVLTHPMVIGEIACGTPPAPRGQTLSDLALLPKIQRAGLQETLAFIERESLFETGRGLVDMMLLASTLITPGATLWMLDQRLAQAARRFGVLHHVPVH